MKRTYALAALTAAMALALSACTSPAPQNSAAANPSASGAAESGYVWDVQRPEGLPEGYPTKDIDYIFEYGTGSINDTYFRILAESIKKHEGWKRGFVVKQKEGGGGDIGFTAFMQAKPDGYTFAFSPTAMQITAIGLGRNYTADNVTYVFNMMSDPGAVGVASGSEYNTLADLCNAAIEHPGEVSIAIQSLVGGDGLAVTQLQKAAGCQFNVVPYDSEIEVLTAVAGGHCDAFCLNVGDCTTFLEQGTIKMLAVGSEERSENYPDVPTYQESGYDVVQVNSRAICAPKGTDEAILQYLSDCFMAAAQDPEVLEQCEAMKIPYDWRDYKETEEMFQGYYQSYLALWNEDPWM